MTFIQRQYAASCLGLWDICLITLSHWSWARTSKDLHKTTTTNPSYPFKSHRNISKFCIFSCSLDHSFNSTHSILTIQGFLERSLREEENEVDHDSQHTVYPALDRSDSTKNAPNASNCVPLQIFHFTRSWSSNFFAVYS